MQTLTRLYAESINHTRRNFTRGELAMCIDVSNAVYLDVRGVSDVLIADVADSFADLPGEYETKWGIDKDALVAKLRTLAPFDLAALTIWANAYWYDHERDLPDFEAYLKAPVVPQDEVILQAVTLLRRASDLQEQTKGAFKSKLIAEARSLIGQAVDLLTGDAIPESAAATLGRKGGLVKSEAKAAASRENGKKAHQGKGEER